MENDIEKHSVVENRKWNLFLKENLLGNVELNFFYSRTGKIFTKMVNFE